MKLRKSVLFALLAVAATSITACNKKSKADVVFWSSFGAKYREILNGITEDLSKELGFKIEHISKGSYDNILTAIQQSMGTGTFPGVAVGYPDHFAYYHGSDMLVPLDSYVTSDMMADYDPDYMNENYIYERDGSKHLYGVPFNKSTELLGYNGVFIDYCVEHYENDTSLRTLPKTWDEWLDFDNPGSKVAKYQAAFQDLIEHKKVLYATQAEDGTASGFTDEAGAGKVKVFDYSKVDANQTRLFTWDATDNAFITLLRQYKSQYTELPSDQYSVNPLRRKGKVLFASSANLPQTLAMLKDVNRMAKAKIFGVPENVGGNYSSDAFSEGRVMFMVCSSGGLSYNTSKWENRFRVAPIPYKYEDEKYVISQGANLCMTTNGDASKNFALIKGLTTGKYQTQWAKETGYFPASNSAADTEEYQTFINGTSYANKTIVTYREGARLNEEEYRGKAHAGDASWSPWHRFVDDAFVSSSDVRIAVKEIIPNVLKNVSDVESDEGYKTELRKLLNGSSIKGSQNITVDSAL